MFRLLSSDEQHRAERFHFEFLRNRFVVARSMLRILLSHYVHLPPQNIVFRYAITGKPALARISSHTMSELKFNLSHSCDLALYAITLGREVGVDVELVKPIPDFEKIAEQYFSPTECEDLASVSVDKKLEAFYSCWTRKEAYIKAVGEGLSIPLNSFSVPMQPGSPIRFTNSYAVPPQASDWAFHELRPSNGYIGSLAFTRPDRSVHMWTFSSIMEAFELLSRGDNSS